MQFLETRSEVKFKVIVTQFWYATLSHFKMHPHTKFEIPSAFGTRPWTNRFRSASTTIVSSSPQSHMVDPDWIHILGKQRLPCVTGKGHVYVTCQCSKNRCFWRVIDHKYQAPCCVAWCTVLFRSISTYHVSNKFSPGYV